MKHTKETYERISKALTGRKLTKEQCLKISKAHKGKPLSFEHRQKISARLTNHEKLSKVVGQFSLDGSLLRIFPSTMQVKRELGYNCGSISNACSGHYKTYKGYIWRHI